MFSIILQILLFQFCFLALYEIVLRKETFFNYNRAYLLCTAIASIVFPFIKINIFGKAISQQFMTKLPDFFIGEKPANAIILPLTNMASKNTSIIISFFSTAPIWYAGIFLTTLFLAYKSYTLYKLINQNKKYYENKFTFIILKNSTDAFSFFNTLFIGDLIEKSHKKSIIQHEKIHAKQYHTVDLLVFEFLKIIFWFNPFIYIYQKRISEVHEFIADKNVATQYSNYYENLLAKTFGVQQFSFVNQFYSSTLIKKRIIMLNKQQSTRKQLVKYLSIIPLVTGMFFYMSCTKNMFNDTIVPEKTTTIITEEIIDYNNELEVPFRVIDQVPIYLGCDESKTEAEIKKCFNQKLIVFINTNFNIELTKKNGLTGNQKILVSFKIGKNGEITEVKAKASHPTLQTEAERVINALPKFKAGKQNGKPVIVPVALPILFKVK